MCAICIFVNYLVEKGIMVIGIMVKQNGASIYISMKCIERYCCN